jgi:Zn-dependent protease
VDVSYFRKPVRDHILVTLAGPASNIALCFISAIVGGILVKIAGQSELFGLVGRFIQINALLAVFNMIPIPPLDGSHLMKYAVNMSDEAYRRFSSFGFIILIVLINLGPFQLFFGKAIETVARPFLMIAFAIAS